MKFSNGRWLLKEGMACFSPAEIYFHSIAPNKVTLLTPTKKVASRGDTLGGVNLTIEITAPMKEVLRIKTYHHAGIKAKQPMFELNTGGDLPLQVEEEDGILKIKNGELRLEINKNNGDMVYYRGNVKLTKSSDNDLAYVKTDWKGHAYDRGNEENTYMREQLSITVGENIYGLGERFTAFIKNGQTVEIWNEDGGTCSEQSYKNIPFYISNKGYGVFVNHPEKVSYEIASEVVTKVGFSVEGESLDYFIINGPSMKEVLTRYTDLTGKPGLPAPWTFGLWLSTSFTTNYDEKTVTSFVDGMLNRGIPLSVFHFDCFWMKDFCWSNFTWDSRVFPDPRGMLQRLKEKGLKICVWINSYIAQESSLFQEGLEAGYFLKRPNGDVWQWDMWQPGMAIVDFTNPAACKWYSDKLEELLDMGVDCFKTDFGERIPTDVVYYDGSDPNKMHNYYTYQYNKTVYDLLVRKRGKREAILFARSATAGGQKFPVHWGGDCFSDFESMEQSLRGGLSLTMSGFGFWSHDIGGFESTSTPDVYKRWAAFGLLSTHSRLHGSNSYRVPWAYDEEAVNVVRFFSKLKASLMPYLYRNAVETSITGVPMMRSMVLEFSEDITCGFLDKQYMLGDSLLVAPIFNEEGVAKYYLPEGTWTNYLTNERVEGGRWISETHGYLSLPIMVREGSILAIGATEDTAVYEYGKDILLKVYGLEDEKELCTLVYDEAKDSEIPVVSVAAKVYKKGNSITIEVVSESSFKVELIHIMNVKCATSVGLESDVTFEVSEHSTIVSASTGTTIVCMLEN